MAKLEVRNLSISFRTNNGAVRAVRDISFDLNEGETLAIAGESGSGKSVTTRAVMGILAGNAMVDNGTIIYDGMDLLKIPEEEFHTLRGHKLSMVFQDPLSALNPIMRIGKQLTEAMILNNKERRQDGRERFNTMLANLKNTMMEALGEGSRTEVEQQINIFDAFNIMGIKEQQKHEASLAVMNEILDIIETIKTSLLKGETKTILAHSSSIAAKSMRVTSPYISASASELRDMANDLVTIARTFKAGDEEKLQYSLNEIGQLVQDTIAMKQPDFFRIGYMLYKHYDVDKSLPVDELNLKTLDIMNREFMDDFAEKTVKAVAISKDKSRENIVKAIEVLQKKLPIFEFKVWDIKACTTAIKAISAAVKMTIDPLRLDKDNLAYVCESSLRSGLKRYEYGLKHNPKEEKRYQSDTVKYNKLKAAGKFAPSVVPKNLVDIKLVQRNTVNTIKALIEHFNKALELDAHASDADNAEAIIDYLKACAADAAYILTKEIAKHRAIVLMKEVGIPEPEKRYHQYPFEFSGGMRQRIVIAIALSANPDILICDEPTTALDVTIQAQILELINRLKKERKLSVIFITHDLGVVANMADRIAIMYAGKIVEYGTADEVFYDPRHPYTWALLASMPDLETKEKLEAIPGTPPNMILPPKGDAFAARNKYAMQIDFEEQPPMFDVTPTHSAATWLLHPDAPKVKPPVIVTERIERMKRKEQEGGTRA